MRTQAQLITEWSATSGGKSTFARDRFLESLTEHEDIIFRLAMTYETLAGQQALEVAIRRFNELPDSIKLALLPYMDISSRNVAGTSGSQTDSI